MESWSKENAFDFIHNELINLAQFNKNNEKEIENSLQENLEFFRCMVFQSPDTNAGPLLPKTPKANRKNAFLCIETIHEDEAIQLKLPRTTNRSSDRNKTNVESNDVNGDTSNRRSNRTASKRAASSIALQQGMSLASKLRRPSENDTSTTKPAQKQNCETSDSDQDEASVPLHQKKTSKLSLQNKKTTKNLPSVQQNSTFILESANKTDSSQPKEQLSTGKRKHSEIRSPSPCIPIRTRSSKNHSGEPAIKKILIDETVEKSIINDTLESSVYEDAIGRPAPIHNSTKIIDTTVTLERKSPTESKVSGQKVEESNDTLKCTNHATMNVTVVLDAVPKKIKTIDHLISDDDDDEIGCTPEIKNFSKGGPQLGYRSQVNKAVANTYKPNALFSPYAIDSVKKRVEAFEQVVMNSPKSVDVDTSTRVTRTKTRAMAAAAASVNSTETAHAVQPMRSVQSVAQKLARKSLAKAKKISLARQIKDTDDGKENDIHSAPVKPHKLLATNEKLLQKQQHRITPVGKSRLLPPMSINRQHHTPSTQQTLSSHSKAMSASRTNIIMNVDSFLQSSKQAQQLGLTEKLEEKRRKMNDEDARRKRDEALKAQTEEKKRKRKEKELKNKLAREAKEKLDMEKRLKAEREREEKAKLALQMQEKQREEAEKKRLLQLQRAQEKEERRKHEEQLRLLRIQEQEEMERQLAEKKRKEQELAERQQQRRNAEAKAQQQALLEAAKIKAQYQAKVQGPTSYKIESEPDEDDDASDNEEAPKYAVPTWANSVVRREQLVLQKYLPSYEIHRFFDSRQCTPDLAQIFEDIDKRRLKRTSSAIWKTPPRYSMMYRE